MMRYPLADTLEFEAHAVEQSQANLRRALAMRQSRFKPYSFMSFRYFWDGRCGQPTGWLKDCFASLCQRSLFLLRCQKSINSTPVR